MPIRTKEELIALLIEDGYLKTPAVIEAFRAIDRKNFVSSEFEGDAYANHPLPTDAGQTISQPLTVAFMIELLAPQPGDKVLDIGAGSGWQTALLAKIVTDGGAPGKVFALERVAKLAKIAEENVAKYGFIESGAVDVILKDGKLGQSSEAPFDKIIAAASAETIPLVWKAQLKIGGRLVAPVGHNIVVIEKRSKEDFEEKRYFGFNFVPLLGGVDKTKVPLDGIKGSATMGTTDGSDENIPRRLP